MSDDALERIWTPHRMAYVRTAVDDEGCPFCAIPSHPDEETLVEAVKANGAIIRLWLPRSTMPPAAKACFRPALVVPFVQPGIGFSGFIGSSGPLAGAERLQ